MSPYVGIFPFLLSLFLYITVGPFVLLFVLINELCRLVVSIYLKFKYNGNIFLISSGADALFSGKIPGKTRMIIIGTRFKGKVEKEEIFQIYSDSVLKENAQGNQAYDRIGYLITQKFGYGCWQIDPNFDLNNHIRFLDDKVYNKTDIHDLIKELSEDMDTSRPEWDSVIVSRYKEDGDETECTCAFVRFHHSYMDGLSTVIFIEKYFCSNFTYYLDPMKDIIAPWLMSLYFVYAAIFAPSTLVISYFKSLKGVWPVIETPKGEKVEMNYRWTEDLNLDNIKKIKTVTSTTLSAVVENAFMSAVTQTLPSKRFPKEWVVGEVAAILPYKECRPQNRLTGFIYTINSLEDDFTRLRSSKDAAWDGMISPFIPLVYFLFAIMGRMPEFIRFRMLSQMSNTFSFSNVPGSKTKVVGFGNKEILEIFGFPPQPNNTGISLGCGTYMKTVKIGCAAQSNWLTKEELNDIMEKVPKIIVEWAMEADQLRLKAE